jgi:hypothetical protein
MKGQALLYLYAAVVARQKGHAARRIAGGLPPSLSHDAGSRGPHLSEVPKRMDVVSKLAQSHRVNCSSGGEYALGFEALPDQRVGAPPQNCCTEVENVSDRVVRAPYRLEIHRQRGVGAVHRRNEIVDVRRARVVMVFDHSSLPLR